MYSECSLIRRNSFSKNARIDEFGRLTGCSLVLVHYIGTEKLWQIKRFGRLRGLADKAVAD